MRWLREWRNTPFLIILAAASILAVLLYFGVVKPYTMLATGAPIDTSYYWNPNMWEKLPPATPYMTQWDVVDILAALICLLLGFLCLLLGIARSVNKLDWKPSLLMAGFLVLFALNMLSVMSFSAEYFHPAVLFYTHYVTFFLYPVPLFSYFFLSLRTEVHKWTWPLVVLPAAYGVIAWISYYAAGLPLDMPAKPFTPLCAGCYILLLYSGLVGVRKKGPLLFMRVLSLYWGGLVSLCSS